MPILWETIPDIFDNIKQFQFYQEKPGDILFKYIPKDSFSCRDLDKIGNGLISKLGKDMHLSFKQVNKIPRTRSGKFRFLEQKLEITYGE
jgi:phenylacetate-CoA ligase